MSRIGKKIIEVPKGVDITINGNEVVVKGPKGQLSRVFPSVVEMKLEENILSVILKDAKPENLKLWGLSRALLANMVKGVSDGFEKVLEFSGVGYKAAVKGTGIELNLGFSHPVFVEAPQGVTFTVEKNTIMIRGIDKEPIGEVAAKIRDFRRPEPYKGTGIKYRGEIVRRKAGKKAATA